MHGAFTWNELNTWTPDAAQAFYGSVLGWSFDAVPMPGGTYYIAKVDGQMAAGIFPMTSPAFDGIPDHWLAYAEVDDADAAVAAVTASGGQVLRPPFDVPGVGRIAIVKDAGGAVLGLMMPVPRQG